MTDEERRVSDWLDSGIAWISGFVPPGSAASHARRWSQELEKLTAGWSPVVVDGALLLGERAALTGWRPAGLTSAGGSCRMVRCADGWLAVSLPRSEDLDLVAPLIERPVTDPWDALREWAAPRPAAVAVERSALLGLAVSRVGEGTAPFRLPAPTPATVRAAPLVVDFSSLWAGPLCSSLLGLAGARVIKVESGARLDGAREGNRAFYDLLNAGHESVCVDPRSAADRAALLALVTVADVVIEGSRPRALAGWGLSAVDAVAAGTVWTSITAYGRAAPERIGFGDDVAAGAGLVGWSAEQPAFVGDAIADPLTGLAAAVATLGALAAGGGRLLDIAMASVVASTLDGGAALQAPSEGVPQPQSRPVPAPAAPAGVDTARVLAELAR